MNLDLSLSILLSRKFGIWKLNITRTDTYILVRRKWEQCGENFQERGSIDCKKNVLLQFEGSWEARVKWGGGYKAAVWQAETGCLWLYVYASL